MKKDKKEEYRKRGKRNRAAGVRFEAKVRSDLESMGWVVDKWTNTVDYSERKIIPAKRKFNPYSRVMSIGTGFPDFIAFKLIEGKREIVGVEVKRRGYLDRSEKDMCKWLLENKIFSRILIAKEYKDKEDKRKISVEYIDFKEKYGEKNE